ncbi:hypothetical protein GGS23DRAFT_248648 [Durotheca rogersii]|uniref:uncharacterized protein n=1 Tax=Durotheca rogersii TaxID=419775 RepID=UPI00221FD814|nr:uncharacterized protein GGS23DRAFT_248648 [Durotheca rogersii]KAI5860092.1 hypothetical protein GGS23DRAFT_248648 [Durotheca rogersii]
MCGRYLSIWRGARPGYMIHVLQAERVVRIQIEPAWRPMRCYRPVPESWARETQCMSGRVRYGWMDGWTCNGGKPRSRAILGHFFLGRLVPSFHHSLQGRYIDFLYTYASGPTIRPSYSRHRRTRRYLSALFVSLFFLTIEPRPLPPSDPSKLFPIEPRPRCEKATATGRRVTYIVCVRVEATRPGVAHICTLPLPRLVVEGCETSPGRPLKLTIVFPLPPPSAFNPDLQHSACSDARVAIGGLLRSHSVFGISRLNLGAGS